MDEDRDALMESAEELHGDAAAVVGAGGDVGAPVIVQSPETASAQAMQAIVRETATSLALRAHKLQFDHGDKGPSLKISGGISSASKPQKSGLPILN